MKKRIAVIGANAAITMLIEKVKSMGYECHAFAWQCGDPGETAADFFYPISIDEKEKILEKCKELGIEGICSITSDFAAPTVSYVARELGLPCNPERTGIVARNKYEMRCAFRDAGLYTPVFYQAGADFSLDDMPALEYPVIVKPTDRWSSKGVTRVDRPEELKAAVDYAVSESFNNKAIIEGFMDGPEYSAECICYKGQRHVLAFTKKQTTGCPHYIETGHIQPSDIPADRIDAVKNVILKGLEALDIQNGAAHAEFRLLENGQVGIVEIGARMGGGCIGTDLTPISTGMDYIRMVVDVACGRAPKFETVTEPSPVAVKFILTEEDLRTMEKVLREESEKVVRTEISNTDFSVKVVDGNMRHGYYIVKM